uniref:Unkown protein n=1 Tax=Riptortus pedestris TaxID=329032 RepID=R4WE86_RIPPE|nr:unkown protein [Riptortus pedestris]
MQINHYQFQLCTDLMDVVAFRLRNLQNYKIASTMHKSANGSKGQEANLMPETFGNFNRSKYYCDGETSRVVCLSNLDQRLATEMCIFALRIRKEATGLADERTWACFDYCHYSRVPDSWNKNRNTIFANGLKLLICGDKTTVIVDRRPFRTAMLRTAIMLKARE